VTCSADGEEAAPRVHVKARIVAAEPVAAAAVAAVLEPAEKTDQERRPSNHTKIPNAPAAPNVSAISSTGAKVTWEPVEDPNKVCPGLGRECFFCSEECHRG
jgi:hypothetical protein